ncbi:MAG: zf-HC2 domain-containing protein, partial [Vicinamibacterales bacterium]
MTHDQAVETLAAERYLLDEMSEIERFRFEEHFFECEECAETMQLGHRLRSDAKEVFAAAPARPVSEAATAATGNRHPWWHPTRVALPWAAAAVLALGLVYQARDPAISGTTEETRVLSPVVLRPASRGQVPDVVLPEQGDVALWLDLTAVAPDEPITYKLTGDDGGLVDS